MTIKWEDLSITDRTKSFNNLKAKFESRNRAVSADTLAKLAEWGYTPDRLEIENFMNYEVELDALRPTPKAPTAVDTGFNLTEATRLAKAEIDAKLNAESAARLASTSIPRALSW